MKRSEQNGICLPGKVAFVGEFVERVTKSHLLHKHCSYTSFFACSFVCFQFVVCYLQFKFKTMFCNYCL